MLLYNNRALNHLAMSIVGLSSQEQQDVLQLVAAILHLSNVTFAEDRANTASIQDERCNVSKKLFFSFYPLLLLLLLLVYIINLAIAYAVIIIKDWSGVCCLMASYVFFVI